MRVVRGDGGVVDGGGEFLGVVAGRIVAGVDGRGVAQRPLTAIVIVGIGIVVVGGVGLRRRPVGLVCVLWTGCLLIIWRSLWGLRGLLLRAWHGRTRIGDVLVLRRRRGCCSVFCVNVSSYRMEPLQNSRNQAASRLEGINLAKHPLIHHFKRCDKVLTYWTASTGGFPLEGARPC